jgi:serine/threonine protein kinase
MYTIRFDSNDYPSNDEAHVFNTDQPPVFALGKIVSDLYPNQKKEEEPTHLFVEGIRGVGNNVDIRYILPIPVIEDREDYVVTTSVPSFFGSGTTLNKEEKNGSIRLTNLFNNDIEVKHSLLLYLGGEGDGSIKIHDLELMWRGRKEPAVRDRLYENMRKWSTLTTDQYVQPLVYRDDSTSFPSNREVVGKMRSIYTDIVESEGSRYDNPAELVTAYISDIKFYEETVQEPGLIYNTSVSKTFFDTTGTVFTENEFAMEFLRNHLLVSTMVHHGLTISDKGEVEQCLVLHTLRSASLNEVLKSVQMLEEKYELNFGDLDPSKIAIRFLVHEVNTDDGTMKPYYGNLVNDFLTKVLIWHPVPYFDFSTLANISGSIGGFTFTSRINGRNRQPTMVDRVFNTILGGRFITAVESLDKDFSGLLGNNVPMLIIRLMYITGLDYDNSGEGSQFRHLFYMMFLDHSYLKNLRKIGSLKFLDEHIWGETNNALISVINALSKARGRDARLQKSNNLPYLKDCELGPEFFLSFPASMSSNYFIEGRVIANMITAANEQLLKGWRRLDPPSAICTHRSFYTSNQEKTLLSLVKSAYVSGVGNITKRGKIPITLENNAILSLVKNSRSIEELMTSRQSDSEWWSRLMAITSTPASQGQQWPIITRVSISTDKSLIAAGKGGGEIYMIARAKKVTDTTQQENMDSYMWLKYIHSLYELLTADSDFVFDIYKLPGMFLEFEADVRTKLVDYLGQLKDVTFNAIQSSVERWFDYVLNLLGYLRTDFDISIRKRLILTTVQSERDTILLDHTKVYSVFSAAIDAINVIRISVVHILGVVLGEYKSLPAAPTTSLGGSISMLAYPTTPIGEKMPSHSLMGVVESLLNAVPNDQKYATAMEILQGVPLVESDVHTYENLFTAYRTAILFSESVEKSTAAQKSFHQHITVLSEIDEKVTTLEVRALSVVSAIERSTRLSTIITKTVKKTLSIYDIMGQLGTLLPVNVNVWVSEKPLTGGKINVKREVVDFLTNDPIYTSVYIGELDVGVDMWRDMEETTILPLESLLKVTNKQLIEVKNPLLDPEQYELLALKTFPVESHSNQDSLDQQLHRMKENRKKIVERSDANQTNHIVHGELKTSETQTEVLISLMTSRLYTTGKSPHFVEVTGAFTMATGRYNKHEKSKKERYVLEQDATDAMSGDKWSPLTILQRILKGEENILDIARDLSIKENGSEIIKKTRDIYNIIGSKAEVVDNNINLILSLIEGGGAGGGEASASVDGTQTFIVMELIDRDMSKMKDVYELLYNNVYKGVSLMDQDIPSYTECVENAIQQVVIALTLFQHELKGMHRDLHPGNVFVKICDIKQFGKTPLKEHERLKTVVGGVTYSVPNLGFVCKLADYGLSTVSWDSPDHSSQVDIQTDYTNSEKSITYFDPLRDISSESIISFVVNEYMNTLNMSKFLVFLDSVTNDLVKKRIGEMIPFTTLVKDGTTEMSGFIFTISSMFVGFLPTSISGVAVLVTLEAAQKALDAIKSWASSQKLQDISVFSILKILSVVGIIVGAQGAFSWLTSLGTVDISAALNIIMSGISSIATGVASATTTIGLVGSAASIWQWARGGTSDPISRLFEWTVGITASQLVGKTLVSVLWDRFVSQYVAPIVAVKLRIPEQADQLFKPIDFRKSRRYTPGYDLATFFNGLANNPWTWTASTIKYYYDMERAAHITKFRNDDHVQFYQINDPKYTFPIHTLGNNVVSHFYPDAKWVITSPAQFLERLVDITSQHGNRGIRVEFSGITPTTSYYLGSNTNNINNTNLSYTSIPCSWCHIKEATMVCSDCNDHYYCTKECSDNDWDTICGTHSYAC